jgi:hypothetical protein
LVKEFSGSQQIARILSVAVSPQANYIDRSAAAVGEAIADFCG